MSFIFPGLLLSCYIAPFVNLYSSGALTWNFGYHLSIHLIFTMIVGITLFLGVTAIIESLEYLFAIRITESTDYAQIILFTFIIPMVALSGIPQINISDNTRHPEYIHKLILFVVLPLLLVYSVIIIAYTVKILVNLEIPDGSVVSMVGPFASAGIVAYVISYPWHDKDPIISGVFRIFLALIWIPLLLMAFAIGQRIHIYGVTEARYAVLLCLIWLAVSAAAAMMMRRALALKLCVALLAVLLIAASFGPWSAADVSARSQRNQLADLLIKYGILQNGKIGAAQREPDRHDLARISALTDYFVETGKIDDIRSWFTDTSGANIDDPDQSNPGQSDPDQSSPSQSSPSQSRPDQSNPGQGLFAKSAAAEKIVTDMQLAYVPAYARHNTARDAFHYQGPDRIFHPVNVQNFDYIIALRHTDVGSEALPTKITLPRNNNKTQNTPITLSFIEKDYTYRVEFDDSTRIDLSLMDSIKDFLALTHQPDGTLPSIDGQNSTYRLRLIIDDIRGKISSETQAGPDQPVIARLEARLLIGIKAAR